jgi:hypothetical protein
LRYQQGTFLLQLSTGASFQKTLSALSIDQKYIIKIDFDISKGDRLEILKHLDKMNINHATIYPDIKGYAQYNNMQAILESPSIPIR